MVVGLTVNGLTHDSLRPEPMVEDCVSNILMELEARSEVELLAFPLEFSGYILGGATTARGRIAIQRDLIGVVFRLRHSSFPSPLSPMELIPGFYMSYTHDWEHHQHVMRYDRYFLE